VRVDVEATGALARARVSTRVVRAATDEATEDVARAAVQRVHERLHAVLKHPTGYYERHVVADLGAVPPRVHDSGVVYGPWLEGIGSRNATTRFKGYQTFRRAAQELSTDVVKISEPRFDLAVRELNR
jgi:hypothetical protein